MKSDWFRGASEVYGSIKWICTGNAHSSPLHFCFCLYRKRSAMAHTHKTEAQNDLFAGFCTAYKSFATEAIHVGQEPEQWKSMAVVPPISLSTTFKQNAPGNHAVSSSMWMLFKAGGVATNEFSTLIWAHLAKETRRQTSTMPYLPSFNMFLWCNLFCDLFLFMLFNGHTTNSHIECVKSQNFYTW